jgi:hypothetical protein
LARKSRIIFSKVMPCRGLLDLTSDIFISQILFLKQYLILKRQKNQKKHRLKIILSNFFYFLNKKSPLKIRGWRIKYYFPCSLPRVR